MRWSTSVVVLGLLTMSACVSAIEDDDLRMQHEQAGDGEPSSSANPTPLRSATGSASQTPSPAEAQGGTTRTRAGTASSESPTFAQTSARDAGAAPAPADAAVLMGHSDAAVSADAAPPTEAGPGIWADAGGACSYPHYPPTQWAPDEWVPLPSTDPVDARALLEGVRQSIVGRWHGLASTPWTTPYEVDLSFGADGRYAGRCSQLSSDCCVAFYYGTDEDTEIKRYRIDDATLSGNVFGEIDIAFDYGSSYDLPGWQGELSHVERDASGNGLRFEFKTSDGYGPVKYDLRRAP